MKNLMIFMSPTSTLSIDYPGAPNDTPQLLKIQIDNSLNLGWKKEDILLFTNFKYNYSGINAEVIKNSEFSSKEFEFFKNKPRSLKFVALNKLFINGCIKKNYIYWFHDLDSFQLQTFNVKELDMDRHDLASIDSFQAYPDEKRVSWNTCSFFFKFEAKDIIVKTNKIMFKDNVDEETGLDKLTTQDSTLLKRIKFLDYRYGLKNFKLNERYEYATKPIKVIHFHPVEIRSNLKTIDRFAGKQDLKVNLITPLLDKVFRRHGIFRS